ncbi:MAG: hypothetical protein JNG84_12845 [Archangium sp.]|nr:hypothetical protein [Archangium sp.]
MKTRRITISVPAAVAAKAERAAKKGAVGSVSEYFANLAEREPDWVEARAVLDGLIAEAKGISPQARQWANEVLRLGNSKDKTAA